MYEGLFELDVCLDGGIVSKRSFDATEETIDAVGEALRLKEENPDSVVTLLVTSTAEKGSEFCPECGQPDNCGDCDHTPIETPQLVALLCPDQATVFHGNIAERRISRRTVRRRPQPGGIRPGGLPPAA